MNVTSASKEKRQPPGRLEDPRLLTGHGRYVDDLREEGQVYMGMVRSPLAHATIKRIDFSNLRSSPDFVDAMTGDDLLKEGVAPVSQNQWPPQRTAKRYHLAVGETRFAGEPVAAIVVRRKSVLEDLLEQVEVEYEPLPVLTTIEESKKGEIRVFEDWKDNLSQESDVKWGEADKVIASAPYVITAKEGIARQASAPIEPHATLVRYDEGEDLYQVYATVQSVHGLQEHLATELGLPEDKFHVKVMDVGGGFGSKGAQSYPEPLLACLFSRRTGLPVKWTASRTEEFMEAASGRDEYCDITMACNREGKVIALKANVDCDAGVTGTQNHMAQLTLWTMLGPYKIPNVDLHVAVYVTNKMPLGPVRGAGAPEGCYFIERAMDIMAKKIGIDPLELRRRNLPVPGAKPGKPAEPAAEEDYGLLVNSLKAHSHYQELLEWRREVNSKFRAQGPGRSNLVAGLGVSIRGGGGFGGGGEEESWGDESEESNEEETQAKTSGDSGGGQWDAERGSGNREWTSEGGSEGKEKAGRPELDFMSESAKVTLNRDGRVTVYTGSSPHGQGEETTFAQLASEELGVPLSAVAVVWGDTALIPAGIGTFGSRSAATGGSAVVDASRKLRAQLLAKASEVTGADLKELAIRNGRVLSVSRKRDLAKVEEVLDRLGLVELSADSIFTLPSMSYSSGVHICAVTLDPELGAVRIVKYVVVEDCGRMINRAIVEGQLHGGIVHAVGGALLEKLSYDDQGNLLASTFMDYGIPAAPDSPNVEVFHEVTPSSTALDGAKGVGESGTIAAYAAVMNAVNDAINEVRPGKAVNVAPATPDSIVVALTNHPG